MKATLMPFPMAPEEELVRLRSLAGMYVQTILELKNTIGSRGAQLREMETRITELTHVQVNLTRIATTLAIEMPGNLKWLAAERELKEIVQ